MTATVGALVLASGSPRRKEILKRLGFEFRVEVADVDETLRADEAAEAYVERMAREKCQAVRANCEKGETCIAADTIVVLAGQTLGKPENEKHATDMVRRLSGREHQVLTAVAIHVVGQSEAEVRVVCTEVEFRALLPEEIQRYAASGEGQDKAGAYAIQGLGAGLVRSVRGSYDNVVGLPAADVIEMLRACGVLREWP